MQVAKEAILQLAQLYSLRSEVLLDNWENAYCAPQVRSDFFTDIVRQTMVIDLSDLMEPNPPRKRRAKSTIKARDCVIGVVDKSAVLAMVGQLESNASSDDSSLSDPERLRQALSIAPNEDVFTWCDAIAHWMQQHQGKRVSLLQLQQALHMPLVEVWRLATAFSYALSVGWYG